MKNSPQIQPQTQTQIQTSTPPTNTGFASLRKENVTVNEPDYFFEAGVALAMKPGDRTSFLENETELAISDITDMRQRYHLQDEFAREILDFKDAHFPQSEYENYEPYLNLMPFPESQMLLLSSLFMGTHLQIAHDPISDNQPTTDNQPTVVSQETFPENKVIHNENELKTQLLALWHMELNRMFTDTDADTDTDTDTDADTDADTDTDTDTDTGTDTSPDSDAEPLDGTANTTPQTTTQTTTQTQPPKTTPQTDFTDLAVVVTQIMKLDYDNTHKVRLIELFQKENEVFGALATQLWPLANEIKRRSQTLTQEIQERFESPDLLSRLDQSITRHITFSVEQNTKVSITPILFRAETIAIMSDSLVPDDNAQIQVLLGLYALERADQKREAEQSMERISTASKMLADPTRLKVIGLLRQRPMYLKELADTIGLSSATMSHHVQQLINAGLILVEATDLSGQNRRIYYSLAKAAFRSLGAAISALGQGSTHSESSEKS